MSAVSDVPVQLKHRLANGVVEQRSAARLPTLLYTTEDVASLLQCSTKNVRRLIDVDGIPGVTRIGKLLRFNAQAVDDWISRGCPR